MEIVIATIVGIVVIEALAFCIYKIIKMNKDLNELTHNVAQMSECMLEIAKRTVGVDVIEDYRDKSTDFNFPDKEGF